MLNPHRYLSKRQFCKPKRGNFEDHCCCCCCSTTTSSSCSAASSLSSGDRRGRDVPGKRALDALSGSIYRIQMIERGVVAARYRSCTGFGVIFLSVSAFASVYGQRCRCCSCRWGATSEPFVPGRTASDAPGAYLTGHPFVDLENLGGRSAGSLGSIRQLIHRLRSGFLKLDRISRLDKIGLDRRFVLIRPNIF